MSTTATQLVTTLLSGVTVTGVGATFTNDSNGPKQYQAVVVGTGAISATVELWGANIDPITANAADTTKAVLLATFTLAGTTSASDGFYSFAGWPVVFGNVTAISGTGAAVTLTQRK